MTNKKFLELLPVIYPDFITGKDESGNELVFLKNGSNREGIYKITDRTACEAFENHVHIFGKIKETALEDSVAIGKAIAGNLLERLCEKFPEKKFIVTLAVNPKDSTVLRFHQVWEGEPPYLDTGFEYKNTEIFEFRN